jgi:hypothetical protein
MMVGRIPKLLAGAAVLALACGTLLAQDAQLRQPLTAHTTHTGTNTPAKQPPATLKPIFTNLGPTATNDYNDTTGYYVLGSENTVGDPEQWIAVPFTPKAASHVTQLQVAVGLCTTDCSGGSTGIVVVGLYSDSSGTVGTLLASGTATKIPVFGTCCQLVSVTIPSTAVTAGTQYWIGVTTNDTKSPQTTAVWQASNDANTAGDVGLGGWSTFSNNWPAAAANGTIP